MGLGFGAVLCWDSRSAEVKMPGRAGEAMGGNERDLGTWFGEVFCCFSYAFCSEDVS